MPTQVIKLDDLFRVCRCSPAVLGRRKCNLFSSKKNHWRKDCEATVNGDSWTCRPVLKSDGFSSVICYKCKREFEKYENYMKALQVDLQKEIQTVHGRAPKAIRTYVRKDVMSLLVHQKSSIPSPPATISWRAIFPKEPKSWICPVPNQDDLIVVTVVLKNL